MRARSHAELLLSLGLMLALGLLWTGTIPAWQTPDEPDHVAYAERLSQQPLHDVRPDRPTFSDALFRSITLTGAGSTFQDATYKGDFRASSVAAGENELGNMSAAERAADGQLSSRALNNPPFQYAVTAALLRPLDDRGYLNVIFAPRLLSLAMAMVALVFQYLTLRLLFRERSLWLLGLGLLVLMPMYTFAHTSPNPDNALGMFFAAALYIAVRAVTVGYSARWNVAFAMVAAGGLLSKTTFAIVIPVYLFMLIVLLARRGMSWRAFLAHGTVFAGIVLALAGWFYVGAFGVAAGEVAGSGRERHMDFLAYLEWAATHRYRSIVHEYWGVYGWLDTTIDRRLYVVVEVLLAAVAVGATIGAVRAIRRRHVNAAALLVVIGLVPLAAILTAIDFSHVATGLEPHGFIQGRYFMPVTSSLVMIAVYGFANLVHGEGGRRAAVAVLLPALAAFHVISLARYVIPRYYL